MKIIALRGAENVGKSHVINIVYQFMLKDKWTQVPGHFRELGNPAYEDLIDILTMNDVLVGIIGAGDYQIGKMGLGNLINELKNKGCHIIICSCRANPKIEAAVLKYPNHTWVDKTLSVSKENDRIVNNIDAERIYNLI